MLMQFSWRTLLVWRSCLGSALRTSLACTIVACAKLYGPAAIRGHVAFPSFSYLTAIILVNDATLGEVLRGSAQVLYATLQTVLPAILSLWLIGPARISITTMTLAASLSAFVVALPESTHLMSKRIALGQIVLVYVGAFVTGARTEAVMHPVRVAVSTGVGAFASLLALALPYPRLGYYEVKEKSKGFAQVVSDRLKLFVNAFCAGDNTSALALVSQAKCLENTGNKLLRSIELKKVSDCFPMHGLQLNWLKFGSINHMDSIPWERPTTISAPAHLRTPSERLQNLEIPLRGMEMALTSISSLPRKATNEDLKHLLLSLTEDISQTLKQLDCPHQRNSSTAPETDKQAPGKSIQVAFPTHQDDLPSLFFLFCMKLLHSQSVTTRPTCVNQEDNTNPVEESAEELANMKKITAGWFMEITSERLLVAFKCSLALGLSVLCGLLFSKANGFWAGLAVAVSISPWRETTFKSANVRAHGTVLGSVYGVLGCFISQRFMELRILVLIPWIVFTSFLRRSRMYGPAGAVAASVGAILLLGRKGYGPPSDFAITRITEVFIGVSCSILVELLLQPTRASTLARIRLCESLHSIHHCIQSMDFDASVNKSATCLVELKEKQQQLRKHLDELAKYIEEADGEPDFWFLPYPTACYRKILVSLSKMMELLGFAIFGMESLVHESRTLGVIWKDLQEHINGDLDLFKGACSSMECLEEITRTKSISRLEKEFQRNKNNSNDLELGKSPYANGFRVLGPDGEEMEKTLDSFLQHAMEYMGRNHVGEEDRKNDVVLCLSTIGFCMGGLMKETRDVEECVKEIIQWENPSSHVNLYEIHCKIKDLSA